MPISHIPHFLFGTGRLMQSQNWQNAGRAEPCPYTLLGKSQKIKITDSSKFTVIWKRILFADVRRGGVLLRPIAHTPVACEHVFICAFIIKYTCPRRRTISKFKTQKNPPRSYKPKRIFTISIAVYMPNYALLSFSSAFSAASC